MSWKKQLCEGIESIFGIRDENLRRIEKAFDVRLTARGSELQIEGDEEPASRVRSLLRQLSDLLEEGYRFVPTDIDTAIRVMRDAPETPLADFFTTDGILGTVKTLIKPRSANQLAYLRAMVDHDLAVSVGPAGTGKTYLAVAMAAAFLKEERVRRIILARPAVEAGEKLGFLPGDLVEKVNPYLRPLYDALYDIIGFDRVGRMLERGIIEVGEQSADLLIEIRKLAVVKIRTLEKVRDLRAGVAAGQQMLLRRRVRIVNV